MSCSCPLDDYQREKYFFFCSRTNRCLPKDVPCEEKNRCPPGHRHDQATGRCEDIDECAETVRCDQFCFNTIGSYRCACDVGYRLQSDQHTCALRTNEKSFVSMLGLMNDGIYRWTLIDPFVNAKALIMSINDTYLMDYDPAEHFLYLVQCAQPLRSTLQICSKTKGIFRFRLTDGISSDREVIFRPFKTNRRVFTSDDHRRRCLSIDPCDGN